MSIAYLKQKQHFFPSFEQRTHTHVLDPKGMKSNPRRKQPIKINKLLQELSSSGSIYGGKWTFQISGPETESRHKMSTIPRHSGSGMTLMSSGLSEMIAQLPSSSSSLFFHSRLQICSLMSPFSHLAIWSSFQGPTFLNKIDQFPFQPVDKRSSQLAM